MVEYSKVNVKLPDTQLNSTEEMNDIMKIIQALENSNILLKGVTKSIKNETKEHKGDF